MNKLYNVFIREHQIVRFSIEVESMDDLQAAMVEARVRYETRGAQWSSQAECEIDRAEIFAVDELNPQDGSVTRAHDFNGISASVGQPIDLET